MGVAIINDARAYVGPAMATRLASAGFDLVLGRADDDLAAATGALVVGSDDPDEVVAAALERHGRIDSAVGFTGRIVVGRFLKSTVDDLRAAMTGCLEAPYRFLRAVVPPMVEQGSGQVLLLTSAAGARPTPGAPLYSAARAGANMLVRNVAEEVAAKGVQVNAVGTNFMDFPGFLAANKAEDPEGRARVEAQVPMKRLGSLDELAHLCMAFVDGGSRFTTGQFVGFAGGWV